MRESLGLQDNGMQALDDPVLLELMLEDTRCAPDVYKPTNYWSVFEGRFLPELKKLGLYEFRRRRDSILSNFGATDLSPAFGQIDLFGARLLNNRITRSIPLWPKFLSLNNVWLNKTLPIASPDGIRIDQLKLLTYEFARMMGEKVGAKSIDRLTASLVGNPEDIIRIGDNVYTAHILRYYLQYVYCANFIDFDSIEVMVELGSGAGQQVEVLKKLHPDICFLLFDIPPQSYVCEQYLAAVFPDSVVSYKNTRDMDSLPDARRGKIFIFGNWKFPVLENVPIDLFWNSASFQEMEPEVVANYLTYVNQRADVVYLRESMQGKEVASKKGSHGVLNQTKLVHYEKGLCSFQLVDLSPSWMAFGRSPHYSDSFWARVP